MGPEAYGVIGFAMGFVGLFSFLGTLGFDSAHIKRVSEGKNLGSCIGTFLLTKIGLVSLMSVVTISAVFFWKIVMGRGFESSEHELAIFIILGYYILQNISTIFQSTFKAETKIAKDELSRFTGTFFRTVAIIFVALSGLGAIALALAYVFGHLFLFITSFLFFRGYPINKPTKDYFKDYASFAWPLVIMSAATLIMTNLDKVLIQLFWSDEHVGYYFASYRISSLIVLAGSSIGMILFPRISDFYSTRDMNSIKNMLKRSQRYISMFSFPIVMGLTVLAEPFIHILMSDAFYPAIPIFMILPFFAMLHALSIPYQSQFLGMDRPKIVRNIIVFMLVCNVILNIILIPEDIKIIGVKLFGLGATGAAIATVVSYFLGFILYKYASWKYIKVKRDFSMLLHLSAAVIMAFILFGINSIILIDRWYILVAAGLFGLCIYFAILYLFKEFTKDDFYFVLDTINVKKMIKYIKRELK